MMTLFKNLRPLLLSALIFALVASGTPVTLETFAKWGRPSISQRKKTKRYRRHSRAWWRRHRARQRERRERAERRRLERQAALAARKDDSTGTAGGPAKRPADKSGAGSALAVSAPRLPFDAHVPQSWTGGRRGAGGEVTFAVRTEDGRAAGTAVLMPFDAPATTSASPANRRTKTVGNAPIAALRRTVIDRMVAEGGWVVNDMVREMNGRRVFIVVAQTGAPGAPTRSLTFYFTEVDGRIYTLATSAPFEFTGPVAAGSEQFMSTLRPAGSRSLAAQQ